MKRVKSYLLCCCIANRGMLQMTTPWWRKQPFLRPCACIHTYLTNWCPAVTTPASARPRGSLAAAVSTLPAWCSVLHPETDGPCSLPGSSPSWWWMLACLDTNVTTKGKKKKNEACHLPKNPKLLVTWLKADLTNVVLVITAWCISAEAAV